MDPSAAATSNSPSRMPNKTPSSYPDQDDHSSILAATVEPPPRIDVGPVNSQLKDPDIKDFGWNTPPSRVPAPLLNGLSNDDIYTLVRRFNKQIFHVKEIPELPLGTLDLKISQNEEFSPDKLRAALERLYMTVIVGIAAFGKHIARLRSWNEPRRTAAFCAAYYIAWIFKIILPLFFSLLIFLILGPTSRKYLFPPAPLSVVSATTGNLQKPKAGTVGSKDSLSGASEAHKGEAVEQEARHFVAGLSTMAISTAAGKGPGDDGNGNAVGGGEAAAQEIDKQTSSVDGSVPDPVSLATGAIEARHYASGDDASQDPAKKPVENAMWSKARPAMRILENIADTWEMVGNALSPTPPFSRYSPFRLAAPLVPFIFVTYFVSSAVFVRTITFVFGFGFFGQPLIVRGAKWLTEKVPNWREYLDHWRALFKGVPTNAQLTLTLLRIGEKNKAPLPPPPTSADGPTARTEGEESDSDHFDASNYDIDSDHESIPSTITESDDFDHISHGTDKETHDGPETKPKKKPGRKIAGLMKKAVKAGVGSALGVDHIKAVAGSESAKRRIGVVSDPPLTNFKDPLTDAVAAEGGQPEAKLGPLENGEGPSVFSARMHGKPGYVLLISSAASPCISFVYNKPHFSIKSIVGAGSDEIDATELHPEFTVGLADITALRKMGGFGWKGKMVVGWALGREVVDGLEITEKEGKTHTLTAIRGRDELFNRLIAMGDHKWECW